MEMNEKHFKADSWTYLARAEGRANFLQWDISISQPLAGVQIVMEESGSPGPIRRGLPKFREILRRPRGEADVRPHTHTSLSSRLRFEPEYSETTYLRDGYLQRPSLSPTWNFDRTFPSNGISNAVSFIQCLMYGAIVLATSLFAISRERFKLIEAWTG